LYILEPVFLIPECKGLPACFDIKYECFPGISQKINWRVRSGQKQGCNA